MMSVISNVAKAVRPAPKAATTSELTQRLQAAETELNELRQAHETAALEAESGDEAAVARLGGVLERLRQARETVENRKAAHGAAVKRDAALDRERRLGLRKTQLRAARFHLNERDRAAADLAKAIEAAAHAWKSLLASSTQAEAANPAGGEWPHGGLTSFGDIKRLVEGEMWRVGANSDIGARANLPGGSPPDLGLAHNPEGIVPMVDQMQAATAHVITVLSARVEK